MTSPSAVDIVYTISANLCDLRLLIIQVLAPVVILLFLFAGIAYAAGQAFGAETKARAQGWAMSLLTGGIIGMFIALLAPFLVKVFTGMSFEMVGAVC